MDSADIGCSLAEAAESAAYTHYLDTAAMQPKSLHVVYINTSLRTKAEAHNRVPTITCTSSNVVQTVLQAFAQVRAHQTSSRDANRCNKNLASPNLDSIGSVRPFPFPFAFAL